MPLKTPDEEDFRDLSWENEIDSVDKRSVNRYSTMFFDKAEELEEKGDSDASSAYRFLGDVCSMYLKDDDPNEPFGPMAVTSNGRTAALDDFVDEDLDLLSNLLEDVDDPELKARMADIIWTNRRDHEAAETAFEAYLDSAEALLDPESWSIGFDRIERAFEIASMLGNEDLKSDAEDYVIDVLDEFEGKDPKFLTLNSLELLVDHGLGDLEDLAQRAEEAAEFAENEGKWRKAKQLWMLKAKINRKLGEDDKVKNAEIKAGEAILERAEEAQSRSHSAAAYHFQNAVDVFRRAGDTARADNVHERLLEAQKKSTEEMAKIETEISLTEEATEAREAVSDEDLVDALQTFSLISTPPKKQDLQTEVEKITEDYPMSALLPNTIVNDEGKTVAKSGAAIGPDAEEEAIKAEVVKTFQRYYLIEVRGKIQPALEQITREHRIKLRDLLDLCEETPIVPPGRELIFARGLYRGFQGDYISSSHLLIPQIEHTLRYLLKQNGVITSSLQSDGIQEEYSLNVLLHMEEAEDILGEETVFTLDSLLNSKFGPNFRHRMAHGLLEDTQFGSAAGVYTWWFVLHLIFRPIVAMSVAEEDHTNDDPETPRE
jgi:hypothetical protein